MPPTKRGKTPAKKTKGRPTPAKKSSNSSVTPREEGKAVQNNISSRGSKEPREDEAPVAKGKVRGRDSDEVEGVPSTRGASDMVSRWAVWVACGLLGLLGLVCTITFYTRLEQRAILPDDIEADGGKFVRTPDGRVVEYFTCGKKVGGAYMWFQHPFGQTGKMATMRSWCILAERMKLRLVSPSVPGCGLSSDWLVGKARDENTFVNDAALILEQENIRNFYLTCAGAGCAVANPILRRYQHRLLGVAFLSPALPLHVDQASATMSAVSMWARAWLAEDYIGDFLSFVLGNWVSSYHRMAAAPDIKKALAKAEKLGGDAKISKDWVLADSDRSVKRGTQCMGTWMRLVNKDFPVRELDTVVGTKVKCVIASAPDDMTNPPEQQKWYQEQLPRCEMLSVRAAGWGHFHYAMPETLLSAWSRIQKMPSERKLPPAKTPPPPRKVEPVKTVPPTQKPK
jgi:pimeloyl-ACP methyl ester carboxylesterase